MLPQVLPSWGNQSDNTGEREMSKSEHTPGPWNAEIYVHGEFAIVVHRQGHSGGTLVICSRKRHPGRQTEFEANARLIAAAPDLLESLTNLVGLAKLGAASLDKYHAALSDAEAALAKARGEA